MGEGSLQLSVSTRDAFCTIKISILLNSGGAHVQYRAPSKPYSSNVQSQVEKIASTPKAPTAPSPSIPTGLQEVATGLTSTVLSYFCLFLNFIEVGFLFTVSIFMDPHCLLQASERETQGHFKMLNEESRLSRSLCGSSSDKCSLKFIGKQLNIDTQMKTLPRICKWQGREKKVCSHKRSLRNLKSLLFLI